MDERLATIRNIAKGNHARPEDGMCVMECVAFVSGEPFSDHPACADPSATRLAVRINDNWYDDDAERTRDLLPFVLRLAGSRRSREVTMRRCYLLADAAARVFAPMAMDLAKRPDLAEHLRVLAPIVDSASVAAARTVLRKVCADADAYADAYDADAAADAADAAAYAAAYAAAADAYAAAADAAADAADAAADAADAAAYAAAAAAAGKLRAGKRREIRPLLLDLLDRVLREGQDEK